MKGGGGKVVECVDWFWNILKLVFLINVREVER